MQRPIQGYDVALATVEDAEVEARPIAPALRFRYRIRWYEPQNRLLTFSCTTMLEDAATELHWNEWVPGDSATWNWCRTDDPTTSYHPTIDGNG